MDSTSPSLLKQLREPEQSAAWERFVQLYTPLLYRWACRLGLHEADAADLVQEVFVQLLRKLPEFTYQPGKSFRGWLHTMLTNKWRDRPRRLNPSEPQRFDGVAAPDAFAELEENEYRRYLLRRALQVLQPEFAEAHWKAFEQYFLEGKPAEDVAAGLDISVNSVYLAKSRVLTRLRQELEGLLD
jgi:RNA polymerase sigma-70 factor (ECF subfamily)